MNADEHRAHLELTRRRLLQGALATAGLAALGSGFPAWATQAPARASGLIRKPGSRPDPTKPEGADLLPQIDHIIIYMQENQSYDHYLGTLGRGDGFTIGLDGKPTNANVDASGTTVRAFHQASTCDAISGDHSWNGTHRSINGGAMDGFARVSGDNVMGYYDETNLPFYRGLAGTFPICDRWFCSVPGPTYPNRRFLQAATSVGIVATDTAEVLATPTAPNGTIWDRLNAHGISWRDYAIDIWDVILFPTHDVGKFLSDQAPHLKHFPDFLADCKAGTLPQVSILAPGAHDQYDEGSQDVQNGELYSQTIIEAVMQGPAWERSIILLTWDEHGGGYDHVPPPAAVAPDTIAPRIGPSDEPGDFAQYGVRVPGMVISPWSKPGYVSHVVHDHTSILKFVETKFNLGAMTYRDANADDLLDCLDLTKMSFREPPVLPKPGIPDTGSTCQPQPRPDTLKDPATTTTSTTMTTTTSGTGRSTTTTVPGAVAPSSGAVPVPGSATFTG